MKRAWFQIHLSTAMVMMFVTGGLIWANLCGGQHALLTRFTDHMAKPYGWPATAYYLWIGNSPESWKVRGDGILIDALFAGVALLTVFFGCEYFIRRREVRKLPNS
jgi:hypothetical protein